MTTRTSVLSTAGKSKRLLQLIAILPVASLFAANAGAAAISWTGTGPDANWSDTANWNGGAIPGASDTATFDDTATSLPNTVDASITVGGYAVTNTSGTPVTMSIADGQTLTVNGNINLGLLPSGSANATTLTVTGVNGSISAGNVTNAQFTVGVDVGGGAVANTVSMDMSALKTFSFIADGTSSFNVSAGNRIKGTVTLANSTNTISVATINVGTTGTQNTNTGTLNLGAGDNFLNASAINIGTAKQNGAIQFATTTGGLKIRGVDGTDNTRPDITMSNRGQSGSTATTSNLLLNGHFVDILIGNLNMGTVSNSGAVNSALSFDQGSIDVTSIQMGTKINGSKSASGGLTASITVGSSSIDTNHFTVNSLGGGSFSMANKNNNSGTFASTFDVKGGTATINADITQTGGAAASVNVIVEGGTLDMTGHNIGSAADPITLTVTGGTVKNLNAINDTAGLTIADNLTTPAGTVFEGTNSYAGATAVTTGRLTVNGTLSNSPVTVSAGASLAGNGTIGNTVEIAGTLVPGNGPGFVINNTLTFDPGSHFAFDVGSNDGTTAVSLLAFNFEHAVLGTGNAILDLTGVIDYTKIYTLFQNTSSTPSDFAFAGVTGYDSADFTPVFSSSGSNYLLSFTPTAVPEPASLGLLAFGAAALLTRRRR